jgi:uridine kinase
VAPSDSVLLFDGVFLFRPELNDYWDFRIRLEVEFQIAIERSCLRDLALYGSAEAIRHRFATRYVPAQQHYIEAAKPQEVADVVVDNNEPSRPSVLRW